MVDTDILTAVSKTVHKALNVPIYLEFKENNMSFPCAYIKVIEPSMSRHVGSLYNTSLDLDIMYYSNNLDVVTDTRFQVCCISCSNSYKLGNVQLWAQV